MVSPLSAATERAYAGDLQDIIAWCVSRELDGGVGGLDERRVFAYLVDLIRAGRSAATVRRRLTALRSLGGPRHGLAIDAAALFELERRALEGRESRTGVLIISDDPIIRVGLRSVLRESGVLSWSDTVPEVDSKTLTVWDYALVWVATTRGIDRYDAVQSLHSLGPAITTRVPIVAIYPGTLPLVVRLRLAEAGVRYAIPHEWLSDHLNDLSARLAAAEIPEQFHLETPLALRQRLGFNLAGELAALLAEASRLPREVWVDQGPQQRLPISRVEVQRLRSVALTGAGIPAPSFSKYATSLRTPPTTPEWGRVREIVREAFDLRLSPR